MYMYCTALDLQLPPCLPAGSVHVQYMNCHHQHNWKSLTCLVSGNLLGWALFLLLQSYLLAPTLSLALARSEWLSLEVDVKVKAKGTESIT